ncbi:MAG TPA: FG-GAP-like repeat-containing protein [Bryobacteraceae bacterium]|nr:FG-GAP-like repeat-containing protein [Bryobacteraceae bacterium]
MLSKLAIPTLIVVCIAVAVLVHKGQDKEVAHPVSAELIVTRTLEEARGLLIRIRAGEDFATLASKYSIDLSAGDGGYLGNDPNSRGAEVRETLRRLKPGAVSKVFKTPVGYAILKALTEPDAGKMADDYQLRRIRSNLAYVTLAPDESGYGEFLQAIRNELPVSDFSAWQKDLKSVCATREQAPRDAIRALQKLIANDGGHMEPSRLAYARYTLGQLWSSQADFDQAIREMEAAYRIALKDPNSAFVSHMEAVLGINYLHRSAFADPAVDPMINAALIFPTHPGTLHTRQNDREKAIRYLTKCLTRTPHNTELKWLLNLAYMTGGAYPSQVPKEFLIPPSAFASPENLGRFIDVAPAAGLATYGNAGGVIIDDFDNDGLLDIVTSQIDDCAPLRYFHNNGDGTFTDRAPAAGLGGQTGGLNMIQADYNNDGCMDVLVLRGGWEFPRRHSLLRNNCDGTFTDVTAQSGLLDGPARSSNSAVWADIDNDGYLDLFLANEHAPSQLFLNKGDGTFVDISHQAGIDRTAVSKAVTSADYDNDGYPDFYVSNYNGLNFLYHNNGNRTFTEVSRQAEVREPLMSFAAWFFDYDNDGWPDLFVTDYFLSVDEVARSYMGLPVKGETLKLYRNLGNGRFKDVTAGANLDRVFMPMGSNFGDVDNDGFLDIYLGNGNPSFASLLPNVLLHNQDGRRFTDITASSGTGALAKGHGVAFGDLNNDGDEDLFVVMGGPHPGDRSPSRLFANPGKHGNDWITVRLVGVKSNRGGNGARIAVKVVNEGNKQRTIMRTVGSGGSFGASPLQQHIGLGKSAKIETLEIWWPTSKTKQSFNNVGVNQFVEIKEFEKNVTNLTRRSFQLGPVRAHVDRPASGR